MYRVLNQIALSLKQRSKKPKTLAQKIHNKYIPFILNQIKPKQESKLVVCWAVQTQHSGLGFPSVGFIGVLFCRWLQFSFSKRVFLLSLPACSTLLNWASIFLKDVVIDVWVLFQIISSTRASQPFAGSLPLCWAQQALVKEHMRVWLGSVVLSPSPWLILF